MLQELAIGLVALNCFLTLWALRRIVLELQAMVEVIDGRLAGAIQEVVKGGLGDFEPPNPIQAALAEMLTARARGSANPLEVLRDESGRFSE